MSRRGGRRRNSGGAAPERRPGTLWFVTGKGGVGKSVVAAALALRLRRSAARVLLLEVDPRESLHRLLGTAPSGGEEVRGPEGLAFQNLKPRAVLDAWVRRRVPTAALARTLLAHPIYEQFAGGAPGLKELATLDYALGRLDPRSEGRFGEAMDHVVLDAPATGHGVSLLHAPFLIRKVVQEGPFGAMAARQADWLSRPAACRLVAVTLAEELPVQETLELEATLRRRLKRGLDAVVVNALYPPLPRSLPRVPEALRDAVELWRTRRRLQQRETDRLADALETPRTELPLLPLEPGRELLEKLAPALEPVTAAAETRA